MSDFLDNGHEWDGKKKKLFFLLGWRTLFQSKKKRKEETRWLFLESHCLRRKGVSKLASPESLFLTGLTCMLAGSGLIASQPVSSELCAGRKGIKWCLKKRGEEGLLGRADLVRHFFPGSMARHCNIDNLKRWLESIYGYYIKGCNYILS